MNRPHAKSPFAAKAVRQMAVFGCLAVLGAVLAYLTGRGAQILLPALGWLTALIGTVGLGRIITRGIVLALTGPTHLWLAEITILLTALVLIQRVAAALLGLTAPDLVARGLLLITLLSWVLLVFVCVRSTTRQGSSRLTNGPRRDG